MKNYHNDVQSLQRTLDILEFVGDSEHPVPLKVISEGTALPKPTVYRLLHNLERRGYIRTNSEGKYRLGFRLLMMTQKIDQSIEVKQIARPFIEKLNAITKETVHLGVLTSNRIMYIDTIESPLPVRLVARIGATNPVHCTSLGKALLINHSDEDIVAILREQGMEPRTESTLTSPVAYLQEMAKVRKQGFALDDQESARECFCIGAPIYDHQGRIVAAISISGPATRFSKEYAQSEVSRHLKVVTNEISHAFKMLT